MLPRKEREPVGECEAEVEAAEEKVEKETREGQGAEKGVEVVGLVVAMAVRDKR